MKSFSPSSVACSSSKPLSVIIQVGSFKLTGKRVFLMAPIHHHFEKKGWTESQVVIRFWIVAIILAMIGLFHLKARITGISNDPDHRPRDKTVALFGLGGSGIATAKAILAGGANHCLG